MIMRRYRGSSRIAMRDMFRKNIFEISLADLDLKQLKVEIRKRRRKREKPM
jgi:hypothetical protein